MEGRDEACHSVSDRVLGRHYGRGAIRPARRRPRNPAVGGNADPHCRLKARVGRMGRPVCANLVWAGYVVGPGRAG